MARARLGAVEFLAEDFELEPTLLGGGELALHGSNIEQAVLAGPGKFSTLSRASSAKTEHEIVLVSYAPSSVVKVRGSSWLRESNTVPSGKLAM